MTAKPRKTPRRQLADKPNRDTITPLERRFASKHYANPNDLAGALFAAGSRIKKRATLLQTARQMLKSPRVQQELRRLEAEAHDGTQEALAKAAKNQRKVARAAAVIDGAPTDASIAVVVARDVNTIVTREVLVHGVFRLFQIGLMLAPVPTPPLAEGEKAPDPPIPPKYIFDPQLAMNAAKWLGAFQVIPHERATGTGLPSGDTAPEAAVIRNIQEGLEEFRRQVKLSAERSAARRQNTGGEP